MSRQNTKTFLNYIHNFRGIAISYIVTGHCISAFEWKESGSLVKLLGILLLNGSFLFVFISGYLFQHLSDNYKFKDYLLKKICYVGLPYLIMSAPAIIYFVFFEPRLDVSADFYTHPYYVQIFLFYVTGSDLAPFWFIPMVFLFYLISPVLKFCDEKSTCYYLLPALIVLSLMIPRGGIFQSFVHFFSVYVLGMFCSRYKATLNPIIEKKWALFLNLGIITAFVLIEYYTGYDVNYLQKLFLSIFYLALFDKFGQKLNGKFSFLASTSFGVYFIHSYFISVIKLLYFRMRGAYFEASLVNFTVFSVLIMTICVLIIMGFQQVLGKKSRYIVGS